MTYTVRPGDSLWAIAQKFNVSVDELRTWNGMGRRSRNLTVGRELEVWPRTAGGVASQGGTVIAAKATSGLTHHVISGDTLWSVAQRYKVSVDDLRKGNQISDGRSLAAGTKLVVTPPTR